MMRGKDSSHARLRGDCAFLHCSLIIDPAWRFLHRAAVCYTTDDPEEFTTSIYMAKVRRAQGSRNCLFRANSNSGQGTSTISLFHATQWTKRQWHTEKQ